MTKILQNNSALARGLYGQVLGQINKRLVRGIPKIKNVVSSNVSFYLWNSDTVREMLNPSTPLVGVLGLDNASSRLDEVIQAVASDVKIDFVKFRMTTGSVVGGRFTISLVNIDKIEKLPAATIITKNSEINFVSMLLAGDKIWGLDLDASWLFKPNKNFPTSRTSHSLIVDHPNARVIRVPPEFAGSRKDNFISKALDRKEFYQELEQLIHSII